MFTREFWKSSADTFRSTRKLACMAAMIALKVVVGSFFYIPVGENLHVSLSFLLVAVDAMILGPVAGMVSGALTDIIGFMLVPNGPWFAGYTLTAMLGELVYALFFYRQKPDWKRCIASKVITNYGVNVLLGSLWSAMLYSKGYIYYMTKSLIKNSIALPVQIIALFAVMRIVYPFLVKRGAIKAPEGN
ncbi:MAG: folate family ECF transporter S component [Bulleidia sp.]|nr:folate family ECF transporter S component [Bulleidia sp.]